MPDPSHHETLARIGAESRSITIEARKSCADSANHIAHSREAIARSLRLLGDRFHPQRD